MKRSITPQELQALPLSAYRGPIHLPTSADEIYEAVSTLAREEILGFDIETRPSFRRGQHFKPSLIQLAGEHGVYLFQLALIDRHARAPLYHLLELSSPLKVGVAVRRDLSDLQRLFHFNPGGFVDIGDIASSQGYTKTGLRNLAGMLLGCRISKGAQVTNWARRDLTTAQILYAATDADVSRELFLRLRDKFPGAAADHIRAGLSLPRLERGSTV
jgi:ribonuclease D